MDTQHHTAPEDKPGPIRQVIKLLSYPLAVGAGWWTAKINIGDAVYDRLKYDGGIADLRNPLLARRKELTTEAVAQLGTEHAGEAMEKFAKASRAIDNAYFKQVDSRLAELGLSSLEKQWNFIHRSQKQTAIINGVTVTGITIGALLTIGNSKAVSHLFDEGSGVSTETNR